MSDVSMNSNPSYSFSLGMSNIVSEVLDIFQQSNQELWKSLQQTTKDQIEQAAAAIIPHPLLVNSDQPQLLSSPISLENLAFHLAPIDGHLTVTFQGMAVEGSSGAGKDPLAVKFPLETVQPLVQKWAQQLSASYEAMISSVLTQWNRSIEEMGDKSRIAHQMAVMHAISDVFREVRQQRNQDVDLNFLATMLVGGISYLLYQKEDSSGWRDLSIAAVGVSQGVLPENLQAAAQMVAALFGNLLMQQSLLMAIGTIDKDGKKGDELTQQYAEEYAKRILKSIRTDEFNYLLSAIIVQNMGTVDPLLLQRFRMVLRIALLVSALALLYKAQAGGFTAAEILALLRKDKGGKVEKMEGEVAQAIRSELNGVEDREMRASILEEIAAFLDSKPSVKCLTDPAEVAKGLFASREMAGIFIASTLG